MSADALIFRVGELEVTVGGTGLPTRVRPIRRPELDFLQPQAEPGAMIIDGRPQHWAFAGLVTDADETEARYAATDRPELDYTIRNTFAGRWLQRHMLMNTSSAPIAIDDLVLVLSPAGDCVGWVWTAREDTRWAVQPVHGDGPVLVGELTVGTVSEPHAGGFRTGPLVLPPGRRLVLQWRIDVVPATPQVSAGRSGTDATELPITEPYVIEDQDVAVLVPEPLVVQTDDQAQLVISDRPGRFPVELRSARGTRRVDVSWVPSTEDLMIDQVSGWLHGRRSGAGVAILPGAGAALGLQQAFIARLADLGDEAEDALAAHTAHLLDRSELSIMELAFLAQETVRTGEPEPLRRATDALLGLPTARPGLGLAATRVCVAELTTGGDPSAVLHRLQQLAQRPAPIGDRAGDDHLVAAAGALEMITVTGPAGGGPRPAALPTALAVGAELGAGLPGHRLGAITPSVAVYAAAVLDLLPDAMGPDLERHWGTTPHQLAQRTRISAVAAALWPGDGDGSDGESDGESDGAADGHVSDVIGWLVLGRPIE